MRVGGLTQWLRVLIDLVEVPATTWWFTTGLNLVPVGPTSPSNSVDIRYSCGTSMYMHAEILMHIIP